MSTPLRTILRDIRITAPETIECSAVLSRNQAMALFDSDDVLRLVMYRRAVQAGLYNEGGEGIEASTLIDQLILDTGEVWF